MPGRRGASVVARAIGDGLVFVLQAAGVPSISGLGPGVTATIRRASESGMTAVIDDLDARRAATRLGVALTGTIALLVRLDEIGGMGSGIWLRDMLDRLGAIGFRISPALRARALEARRAHPEDR